ncbi:MAG: (2Fe-2S)-binding protein [Pigmentiphaga sp.]
MSAVYNEIDFVLNGRTQHQRVDSRENAVDVLNQCGLKGTRESCGQGLCGCCTIYVEGKPVSGCLYPAWKLKGKDVTTVEALSSGSRIDVVQQAFIDAGAFQCGFCTSGFVLMTKKLLSEHPDPSREQIEHYLAGNLCRCGAYPEIIAAVRLAAERLAANKGEQ